jgi:aminopeptidase N
LIDAFKTVLTDDSFDFEKAFRTWELQKGYPMVHVSFQSGQFQLSQHRFLTNKVEIPSDDRSSWYIPLNFATQTDPNFEDTKITNYFVNDQESFMFNAPAQHDASKWFVFNKQQLGYYRVNYDFANWHNLIVALNSNDFDKIHVLNRAQLIDDSLVFAAGGYFDFEVALSILSYLEHETEYAPFAAADRFISTLYTTFGPTNDDINVS